MSNLSPETRLQYLNRRVRVGGFLAAGAILLSGCGEDDLPACGTAIEDNEGSTRRSFDDLNNERVTVVYSSEFAGLDEPRRKMVNIRGYGDSIFVEADELPRKVLLDEEDPKTFVISFDDSKVIVECASTLDS